MEDAGVVKVPCDNCGCLALFDPETLGIRGLWAEGRAVAFTGWQIPARLLCKERGANDPSTGGLAFENPPNSRKVGEKV